MMYASVFCTMTPNLENRTVTITGPCIVTGKEVSVTVPLEGIYRYADGELIQNAFPDLSRDDREFLMSGHSKEGWDQVFGEKDENAPSDTALPVERSSSDQ